MAKYNISEELKSETRISRYIYLSDFFFIIGAIGVVYLMSGFVHSDLRTEYYIFSFIVAVILTLPSSFNHKRRNWQTMYFALKKDRKVYRPVFDINKWKL